MSESDLEEWIEWETHELEDYAGYEIMVSLGIFKEDGRPRLMIDFMGNSPWGTVKASRYFNTKCAKQLVECLQRCVESMETGGKDE